MCGRAPGSSLYTSHQNEAESQDWPVDLRQRPTRARGRESTDGKYTVSASLSESWVGSREPQIQGSWLWSWFRCLLGTPVFRDLCCCLYVSHWAVFVSPKCIILDPCLWHFPHIDTLITCLFHCLFPKGPALWLGRSDRVRLPYFGWCCFKGYFLLRSWTQQKPMGVTMITQVTNFKPSHRTDEDR